MFHPPAIKKPEPKPLEHPPEKRAKVVRSLFEGPNSIIQIRQLRQDEKPLVMLGYHVSLQRTVVVKLTDDDNEIFWHNQLSTLCPKQVVKLFEIYDACKLPGLPKTSPIINMKALIMEYAINDDLLEYTSQFGGFIDEGIAKPIFRQCLYVLSVLHKHGICHHDIKPENFVVDKFGNVKLCDFGFVTKTPCQDTKCTVQYCPPEVIECFESRKKYDEKSDVYSLGIAFQVLLFGKIPFPVIRKRGKNRLQQLSELERRQIMYGVTCFSINDLMRISRPCRQLILQMTSINPTQRPTATQLLDHEWFGTRESPLCIHHTHPDMMDEDAVHASFSAD